MLQPYCAERRMGQSARQGRSAHACATGTGHRSQHLSSDSKAPTAFLTGLPGFGRSILLQSAQHISIASGKNYRGAVLR